MHELLLPDHLKIGPYDYTVRTDWDDPTSWGYCDYERFEISLDPKAQPMRLADTYLHEIFHAVWDTMRLGEDPDHETVVGNLASGFLAFMRDNPNGLDVVWEAIGTCRREALAKRYNNPPIFRTENDR